MTKCRGNGSDVDKDPGCKSVSWFAKRLRTVTCDESLQLWLFIHSMPDTLLESIVCSILNNRNQTVRSQLVAKDGTSVFLVTRFRTSLSPTDYVSHHLCFYEKVFEYLFSLKFIILCPSIFSKKNNNGIIVVYK